MNLKVLAVVVLAVAIVGSVFVFPASEAAPPQPHTFWGVARQSDGTTVLAFGARMAAFVDGVDYSNGTSVFDGNGNYNMDVYGDNQTDFSPTGDNTPEFKTGADVADQIMFVNGDMGASGGSVFTAARTWYVPLPAPYENLDLTLAALQPANLKIRSITTQPAVVPSVQYLYICNLETSPVDLSDYYLQIDGPGSQNYFGETHQLTGADPLLVLGGGISYVNLTAWSFPTTLSVNGDGIKLVWANPPPGTAFQGGDVIIDRVEWNATGGAGTIYQRGESTSTIMTDAVAATTTGQEIRRKNIPTTCRDTNDNFNDFEIQPETGRPGANADPTVTLTTPNGGQDWTGGTPHDIVWDMNDAEDPIASLTYAIDLLWSGPPLPVTSGMGVAPNPQTYSWTVNPIDTNLARIQVCVFDLGGRSACDTSTSTFTIDSTGPILLPTNPADGAIDVNVNTDVILPFNEGMSQIETELAISFTPFAALMFTWDAPQPNSRQVTVNPTLPLVGATVYTVEVSCLAEDDSDTGNDLQNCPDSFQFTTAGGPIAPTVDLTDPDGLEVWSGLSTHTIFWNMSDADTPGNLNVNLDYSTTGAGGPWTVIQAGLSRAQGANTYAWAVPCENTLAARVRVTASDGALSTPDVSLQNFEIDCTPPTVVPPTIPAGSAQDIGLAQLVRVQFSEGMNEAATELAFSFNPALTVTAYTWSQTGTEPSDTVEIAHNAFNPCTTYTATFSVTAPTITRDASDPGVPMAAAYSWTFTTVCSPTVVVTAPAAGAVLSCGSTHPVTFTVTDPGAQVTIWINLSSDGGSTFPTSLHGPVSHQTGVAQTVPVALPGTLDTATAVIRVIAQDVTFRDGFGDSGEFTIDCDPPSVVVASSTPANLATDVSLTADFTIVFDEAMDPTSTEAAITLGTSPLTFTWTGADRVAVHHAKLRAAQSYTLTVQTTALDASDPGNALDPLYTVTFTTTATSGLNAVITGATQSTSGDTEAYDGSASTPQAEITQYRWEFRDPSGVTTPLTGEFQNFTFTREGAWTVILNVTDAAGNWDTDQKTVTVAGGSQRSFLDEYWWLILILIIAVIGALIFLLGKRRKKEEEEPEAAPPKKEEKTSPKGGAPPKGAAPAKTAPGKAGTKECPSCGTILDTKDTECFMCGAKV